MSCARHQALKSAAFVVVMLTLPSFSQSCPAAGRRPARSIAHWTSRAGASARRCTGASAAGAAGALGLLVVCGLLVAFGGTTAKWHPASVMPPMTAATARPERAVILLMPAFHPPQSFPLALCVPYGGPERAGYALDMKEKFS